MTLDIFKSVDIIETMENYISDVRPPLEMRNRLDIGYEIEGQSVILNQIRPFWDDPKKIMTLGYAKTTFVKSANNWKIFWKRADGKWHSYDPCPVVRELEDFLTVVDHDKHGCFSG